MPSPEQALPFPSAKRRCWDLVIVRDNACTSGKAAIEEHEVLDAFRKKYTSARKVVFKPATNDPERDNDQDAESPGGINSEETATPLATAASTAFNNADGMICVQVEFAGPQPIKGPAEVMCGLLGGVSVAATPVFLARGRRKKRPKTSCASGMMSVEGAGLAADEVACGGVVDTGNTSSGTSRKNCREDGEDEEATAAAAVESGESSTPMLSETSWESMPLWHLAAAPADTDAADDFLWKWGDMPHGTGNGEGDDDGTFPCPSSTEGLSTSTSSMSLLSGFGSSSSGLSIWEDLDCETGMPQQEAPAQLFETALEATDRPTSHLFSPPHEDAVGGHASASVCLGRAEFSDMPPSPEDCGNRRYSTDSSCSSGSCRSGSCSTSSSSTSLGLQRSLRGGASVPTAARKGSINCVGEDGDPPETKNRVASLFGARDAARSGAAATTFCPPNAAGGGGPEEEDEGWEWRSMKAESRGWRRIAAGENIGFGWLRQERDFDGRPAAVPAKLRQEAKASPNTTSTSASSGCGSSDSGAGDKPCRLALKGADRAGYKLRDLAVHARFSASPTGRVVREVATPLEAGGGGQADITEFTVQFPSLEEMWPEMYRVRQILVIEVDMVVEVRSSNGKCLYTGPSLKVTYRRPRTTQDVPQPQQQCTRISSREVLSDCFGQRRRGVCPAAAACVGGCRSAKGKGECSCCTGRVIIGSPSPSCLGPMITPPEDSFAALLI